MTIVTTMTSVPNVRYSPPKPISHVLRTWLQNSSAHHERMTMKHSVVWTAQLQHMRAMWKEDPIPTLTIVKSPDVNSDDAF